MPLFDTIWSDEISLPYLSVPSIDDALTPVRCDTMDAAIRDGLQVIVGPRPMMTGSVRSTEPAWYVHVEHFPPFSPLLEGVTFAVRFDILREEELIATASCWWEQFLYKGRNVLTRGHWQELQAAQLQGDVDRLRMIEGDSARWSIRVRPEPVLALRNFESDRYWAGEARLPLRVVIRNLSGWDEDQKRRAMQSKVLYDSSTDAD